MFEVIKAEAVRNNIKEIVAATTTTIDKLRFMFTVAYMILILYSTVFSRTPGNERIFTGLFWEYRNGVWIDVFPNIAFFIPLGILCVTPDHRFFHLQQSLQDHECFTLNDFGS